MGCKEAENTLSSVPLLGGSHVDQPPQPFRPVLVGCRGPWRAGGTGRAREARYGGAHEGHGGRVPLPRRFRRSGPVLPALEQHQQSLFGLRGRSAEAEARRRGARSRDQVLPRGPCRHALGEGDDRSGYLQALRRADQIRARGLSLRDHLQTAQDRSGKDPLRAVPEISCRPALRLSRSFRAKASPISRSAEPRGSHAFEARTIIGHPVEG